MVLYLSVFIQWLYYLIFCINATETSCSASNSNGKKLENHIYLKLEALMSFQKCKKECYLHRSCQSFNYQTTTYKCELNNAIDTDHSDDLIQDPTWTYTTFNPNEMLSDRCAWDSCQEAEKCIELTVAGFFCKLITQASTSRQAAFHAQKSSNTTPLKGQTVQFGQETLDIGAGYDPSTSIYTVPLTGVYTFTWILDPTFYSTEIVVNNEPKGALITYTEIGQASSTATTVLSVNAGDRVFVRVEHSAGSPMILSNQDGHSTFSGWILN